MNSQSSSLLLPAEREINVINLNLWHATFTFIWLTFVSGGGKSKSSSCFEVASYLMSNWDWTSHYHSSSFHFRFLKNFMIQTMAEKSNCDSLCRQFRVQTVFPNVLLLPFDLTYLWRWNRQWRGASRSSNDRGKSCALGVFLFPSSACPRFSEPTRWTAPSPSDFKIWMYSI